MAITFRLTRPPISGVLRPRLIAVCVAVAGVTFLVFCYGMTIGDYPLGLSGVVSALFGSGQRGDLLVVQELRLPRALAGLLAGIGFGMSGAVFQTVTRNPLGSPDLIGINAGASTAVVAGLTLGFGTGIGTLTLGLAGGLATALVIYLLAWKRGSTGYRIVLVGIGVAAMCTSMTDYLLTRAQISTAHQALGWLVGSLNGRGWEHVKPLAIALAVLVPVTLLLAKPLRSLQLGDEVAMGLGTPVNRARFALVIAGVGLVAFATSAAGPILFAALMAPQIAQRLAGLAWPPLIGSGLTGAFLVVASDLAGRVLEIPVGVVTGALGAPFLLWLLLRANRAGSGG
jgi:iron complex transport system permease protein